MDFRNNRENKMIYLRISLYVTSVTVTCQTGHEQTDRQRPRYSKNKDSNNNCNFQSSYTVHICSRNFNEAFYMVFAYKRTLLQLFLLSKIFL